MSDVRDPETDQRLPTSNGHPSAHDLVAADLAERKAHGFRKYGSLLQAANGRSHLRDAYEEVLDHAVYLRSALDETALLGALITDLESMPPDTMIRAGDLLVALQRPRETPGG